MTFALTLAQIKTFQPCSASFRAARKLLPAATPITIPLAIEAKITLFDIVWVLASLAETDNDVARRLRLWSADCAAHVLHIYEATETSLAPRNAIIAARKFARGQIPCAAAYSAAYFAYFAYSASSAASDAAYSASYAAYSSSYAPYASYAASASSYASYAATANKPKKIKWQTERLALWFSAKEPRVWPLGRV